MISIYKNEEQISAVIEKLKQYEQILKQAGSKTYLDDDDSKRPG